MKRVLSHPLVAIAFGLGLRLFFILEFPATAGDSALYEELASNWFKHATYGGPYHPRLLPPIAQDPDRRHRRLCLDRVRSGHGARALRGSALMGHLLSLTIAAPALAALLLAAGLSAIVHATGLERSARPPFIIFGLPAVAIALAVAAPAFRALTVGTLD